MSLAFFNISGGEIFIIMLVVFLIFGPDKIPEIARWIGKGVGEVKRATSDIRDEISRETEGIKKHTDKLQSDLSLDEPASQKDDTKPRNNKTDENDEIANKAKDPHL